MKLDVPLKLICAAQSYDWGKVAENSFVAALLPDASPGKPYAELWMGVHPRGPSMTEVESKRTSLRELIDQQPERLLGAQQVARWGKTLPYLFKVLSVGRPLSIQLHPGLADAKLLHARDPKNFPDANHKPEIAIAISDAELLYGVKSKAALAETLKQYPEIAELAGAVDEGEEVYSKRIFENTFGVSTERYVDAVRKISTRLTAQQKINSAADIWFLQAFQIFGEQDRGLLCFYLLNHHRLSSGQAVYTAPGVPHAYLSGDFIECMANSDNVVRAGLTSKNIDLKTLFALMDYDVQQAIVIQPQAVKGEAGRVRFQAPVEEFCVERFEGKDNKFNLKLSSAVILICTAGQGEIGCGETSLKLNKGSVYFLPACLEKCVLHCRNSTVFMARPG